MGIRGSIFSIYKTNEKGENVKVKTVYAGPTQSQKERGYIPKIVKAKDIEMKPDQLIKAVIEAKKKPKTKSKKKSKRY